MVYRVLQYLNCRYLGFLLSDTQITILNRPTTSTHTIPLQCVEYDHMLDLFDDLERNPVQLIIFFIAISCWLVCLPCHNGLVIRMQRATRHLSRENSARDDERRGREVARGSGKHVPLMIGTRIRRDMSYPCLRLLLLNRPSYYCRFY